MDGETLRTASAWATSTTSSSSNLVVPALASSAAMIPTTARLIKIPKAVLLSSPEITSTATLISECQDLSRSRFLHGLVFSFVGHYLIHVTTALMNAHVPAANGNNFHLFNISIIGYLVCCVEGSVAQKFAAECFLEDPSSSPSLRSRTGMSIGSMKLLRHAPSVSQGFL